MFRAVVAAFFVFVLSHVTAALAADWPPGAPDLAISILPAAPACLEGEDCRLLVRIENLGTAAYAGPFGFIEKSSVAAVPGPGKTAPWTCKKQDFSRISCTAAGIALAPGGTTDFFLTVRLLPTPKEEAQTCASLDWSGKALTARDQLFRNTLSVLGQEPSDKPATPDLMGALFGAWGDGDLRAANDKDCARIAVLRPPPPPSCGAGEQALNGTCTRLATLCTGGRNWDTATSQCACPADHPVFDPAARSCGTAAALACGSSRTESSGLCICPREAPLWNGKTASCEAFAKPQVAVKVEPEQPAKSEAVEAKPPEPEKFVVAAVEPPKHTARRPDRRRHWRAMSCRRREVLDDGICIRHAPARFTRHARQVRRIRRLRQVSGLRRCPPFFVYNSRRDYCWPALWIDPDIIVNGRIHKR